jgi:spore coat polysaccharide biosynthesis protein SpsF
MPKGFAVDAIDVDVLRRLSELGETHPVARLRKDAGEWKVCFTPNERWEKFAGIDVSVDTPADYWYTIDAMAAVGATPNDLCRWIAQRQAEKG